MDKDESVNKFALAGTTTTFGSRSSDVFAGLDQLEAKHEAYEKVRSHSPSKDDKLMKDDPQVEMGIQFSQHRGSRSHYDPPTGRSSDNWRDSDRTSHVRRDPPTGTFRAPRGRPPRQRRAPDHTVNPEHWKFYDLSDVSKNDLSEKSNTAAAFDFLRSRQKEREEREAEQEKDPVAATNSADTSTDNISLSDNNSFNTASGARHVFKRPGSQPARYTCKDESDDKTQYRDGKRMLPEYVVGSKPSKVSKTVASNTSLGISTSTELAAKSTLSIPDLDDQTSSNVEGEDGSDQAKSDTVSFKSRKKQSRRQLRTQEDEEDNDDE